MAELIELSFGMVSRVLDGRAYATSVVERLCVAVMNNQPEVAMQPIPKFPHVDQTFVQVYDGDPSLQN